MNDVAIERLRELFAYDPETGALIRRRSTGGKAAGTPAGTLSDCGHVKVSVDGKNIRLHRIAIAMTYGRWPDGEVIAKDGDLTNTRIGNLVELAPGTRGKYGSERHAALRQHYAHPSAAMVAEARA